MLKWYWSHARRFWRFWKDDYDGGWLGRLYLGWSFLVTIGGIGLAVVTYVYLVTLGYLLVG
jgi:hypothetical protein